MSIKDIARARVLEMLNKVKPEKEWKILVLDHHTTRVMNATISMHEITENGVTVVEDLMRPRQPLRQFEALYFIDPLEESMDRIIADFDISPLYAAAYVFTSSPCPDALFEKLAKSRAASYLKGFTELNFEFLPLESQVYSLDKPLSFFKLYSSNAKDVPAFNNRLALELATVLATLNDHPYICYTTNSPRTQEFAKNVQAHIDEFVQNGSLSATQPNRGQLLIMDRTLDLVSPVLHDLHYQPLVYDVLPINNDTYKFQDNVMIIGEHDWLWNEFRHLHIGECSAKWGEAYKQFQMETKVKSVNKDKVSLKELQAVMRAAPQHKEKNMRFQLHLELIEQALKQFDKRHLEPLTNAEQDLAMGEDAEGNRIKNHLPAILPLLQNSKIENDDKLRLLMLYVVIKQGISSSDLDKLFDAANLNAEDRTAVNNLSALDVAVTTDQNKIGKDYPRKRRSTEGVFASTRWVPVVKDVMEALLDNKVDRTYINYVRDAPTKAAAGSAASVQPVSARSKPGWASRDKKDKMKVPGSEASFQGPRLTVFVMGGVTFSEMGAAYECTKQYNRQVVIGSSEVLKPSDFLLNMRVLKKSESDADTALKSKGHFDL